MSKKNSLQQTRGNFQVKGIVSGVARNDFFTEKMTKSDNPKLRKAVKFAIQTDKDNKVFVTLAAQPMDKVYFSKRSEVQDEPSTTKAIDWDKRHTFNEDGFRIIGVNVGLAKKLDADGREVNDSKTLVAYDAIDVINENLRDGMSVFIRGRIEYSRFEDRNITQLAIDQISLCQPVDFDEPDFQEVANWEQTIAFVSIEKSEDDDEKFILNGNIVNYNNIVESDFVVRNKKLMQNMKKNLEPYNSIKIFGKLVGRVQEVAVEEVDEDGWGEPNPMKAMGSYTKEMLVTGAEKDSIDTETYSEQAFDEFLRSKKEFGELKPSKSSDDDDEDWD